MKVLHLIKECLNYVGTGQENNIKNRYSMENTGWNIQAKSQKRGCRSIDSGHTTRIRMGQKRRGNIYENSKWTNRLEWRC